MGVGWGLEISPAGRVLACLDARSSGFDPPGLHNPIVVHACNPRTLETEVGRSEVQGQSRLDVELKDSLGYTRPCLQGE